MYKTQSNKKLLLITKKCSIYATMIFTGSAIWTRAEVPPLEYSFNFWQACSAYRICVVLICQEGTTRSSGTPAYHLDEEFHDNYW